MKKTLCRSSHSNLWFFFILDFFSKQWAFKTLDYPVCLSSFLCFDKAINRGISWSFFSSDSTVIFTLVSCFVGIFLFLLSWYVAKRRQEGYCVWAEKLIVIGGTANFLDRLYYGGVMDFIHVFYGNWSFPIFNIADICICVGVVAVLWQTFFNLSNDN